MEQKMKQFRDFNWMNSKEWLMYYDNLYPTPPGHKIEHYKKKFYKLKIDPEFDINWTEPTNQQSQNTSQGHVFNRPQAAGFSNESLLGKLLCFGEFFLWSLFFVTIIYPSNTLKMSAGALLLRVIRRTGKPRFSIEYVQVLFLDEHFQLLLYSVLFMIDRLNIFTLIPLMITATLDMSEIVRSNQRFLKMLKPLSDKIAKNRVQLATTRSNVEIGVGFVLVVGIFLGLNSFFLPMFYWQYLRFKYIVNEDIKLSFGKMNRFLEGVKNKPNTPGFVRFILGKIQQFASYLGRTEAAPGQSAGGQNCSIF